MAAEIIGCILGNIMFYTFPYSHYENTRSHSVS